MVRAAIVLVLATLTAGCILVRDVGDSWDRGEIDRAILGAMESNYNYPGRIELWFAPAAGAPDRKLLETKVMIPGYRPPRYNK